MTTQRQRPRRALATVLAVTVLAVAGALSAVQAGDADDRRRPDRPQFHFAPNDSGVAMTISTNGFIDRRNPFFRELGTNERSCLTCHQPGEGWSMTPPGLAARFQKTQGTDPVFRLVDGANSPLADVSTVMARQQAYSMLLGKGLVRIGLPIPAGAEFELSAVDDPYRYASAAELSLFRRPLSTTNLRFLSTVMWDGRETMKDASSTDCIFNTTTCFASIPSDLALQSNDATIGHAQGALPLTDDERKAIVDFELGIHTAQQEDKGAGRLNVEGANGGPSFLTGVLTYFGINDTLVGDYRSHAPFNPTAMTIFQGWQTYVEDRRSTDPERRSSSVAVARQAIARGQALFDSKPIAITGVGGLNDDLGVAVIPGTCTTCHNTPNAGDHSVPLPLNIGLADASRRTADMPLYSLRNRTTGEIVQTTDPGRALVTGKWKDIGRFKGPTLRALAPRAPYFHNGSAADLDAVVTFYNDRFGIGFTDQEKADLVAFLKAL